MIPGIVASSVAKESGGGGGNAHRYWRVHITATQSTDDFATELNLVEFRALVGGPTQTGSGTAIGSTYQGGYPYSKAFADDGSPWVAERHALLPQWVGYDFGDGGAVEVGEVLIESGAFNKDRTPDDFTIDYSDDGVNWTIYASITGETSWGTNEIRTYTVP